MGNRIKSLLLLITVFTLARCSSPVGNIGGSGAVNVLLTVPNRVAYNLNDLFRRNVDLQVYTSYIGSVQEIPVEQCEISVMEDPDNPDELTTVPLDEDYPFKSMGRKVIVVNYYNLSNQYSIEVRDPFGLGENNGNIGSGGPGIIIEWL